MPDFQVNLLKDRFIKDKVDNFSNKNIDRNITLKQRVPLFIGLGLGMLSFLGISGTIYYLNEQISSTQAHIQDLDLKLARLKRQRQNLISIQKKLADVKSQTQAVVNVFLQIQPISAILKDVSDQIPVGSALDSFSLSDNLSSPGAKNIPVTSIVLTGTAHDFDQVNDFLLALLKSDFFNQNPTITNIQKALLVPTSVAFIKPKDFPKNIEWTPKDNTLVLKSPQEITTITVPANEVQYTINSQLTQIPAGKIIQIMQQKGAQGLVIRIETLKTQGLLKP
jgi:type IV pilus assembly protein PilN